MVCDRQQNDAHLLKHFCQLARVSLTARTPTQPKTNSGNFSGWCDEQINSIQGLQCNWTTNSICAVAVLPIFPAVLIGSSSKAMRSRREVQVRKLLASLARHHGAAPRTSRPSMASSHALQGLLFPSRTFERLCEWRLHHTCRTRQ